MAKSKNAKSKAAFNLDDPVLPPDIEEAALGSGGYPYDKKLKQRRLREPAAAAADRAVEAAVAHG